MSNIKELLGKTLTEIVNDSSEVIFTVDDGTKFKMHHQQDCCESVFVDDIVGDLNDLIGSPITLAEDVDSDELPKDDDGAGDDSFTWTFYKLATVKGYVTIKWLGTSNGYYSESVDFDKIN